MGIPAGSKAHPQTPTTSSNLYKELEFKTLVGVVDHQITKGITEKNAHSSPKNILLKTVFFSFMSENFSR